MFRDGRLLIAVTHFDKYYTSVEDDKLTVENIRQTVCKNVRDAVGECIPEDMVVPVSGSWARSARRLTCNPADESEKKIAMRFLHFYDEEPCGQDDPKSLERSASLLIASKLEKASRIQELEARYFVIPTMATLHFIALIQPCFNHVI